MDDVTNEPSIGFRIIEATGYMIINIAWISVEFKVAPPSNIYIRSKYGENQWSGWSIIS